MKKFLLFIVVVIAVSAGTWLAWHKKAAAPGGTLQSSTASPDPVENPAKEFDKNQFSLTATDSPWLIVNKSRPLPESYTKPSDLVPVNAAKRPGKPAEEYMLRKEAAQGLETLISDAHKAGYDLMIGSGFRSKSLQTTYYENYVKSYGQDKADTFSARPGKSEHQTGLAADVATTDGKCYLEICFGESAAGQWVAGHAYEYGFIVRYPKGKEDITKYQYEPWHIRYVGLELAAELHKSGQTLEEFFSL